MEDRDLQLEAGGHDHSLRLARAAEATFGAGSLPWVRKYAEVMLGLLGMILVFLPLADGAREAVEAWENEGGAL